MNSITALWPRCRVFSPFRKYLLPTWTLPSHLHWAPLFWLLALLSFLPILGNSCQWDYRFYAFCTSFVHLSETARMLAFYWWAALDTTQFIHSLIVIQVVSSMGVSWKLLPWIFLQSRYIGKLEQPASWGPIFAHGFLWAIIPCLLGWKSNHLILTNQAVDEYVLSFLF